MRCGLMGLALLLSAALCGPAFGTVYSFDAILDGFQEVPPNASPAVGLVQLTLDDVTGAVNVTSGTYQTLVGTSTGVALHGMAPPGSSASILIPLTLDSPGSTTGTISGNGTLPGIMAINGMIAGNTYINLRSTVFPSGEIRGQILQVPEPATLSLLTLPAFALMRRRAKRARNRPCPNKKRG